MRFVPISRAEGYEFSGDAFDVRGWEVRTTADGERVGKVDDLLIDDAGSPRYLDVDLGLLKKHVLVPLAHARVDGQDDVVWVDGLTRGEFEDVPEYTRDPRVLSEDYERRLSEVYRGGTVAAARERDADVVRDERESGDVRRLARLGDLKEYRVSKGDADPRGWDVLTGDGRKIGGVTELIVDQTTMEARYLDCDVDERKLELEPVDRHVLIPVEAARLDRGKKNVVVDGLFVKDVASLPIYPGLPLTGDVEHSIRDAFRTGSRRTFGTEPARELGRRDVEPGVDTTPERGPARWRERDDDSLDRFYGARRGQETVLREGETAKLSNGEQEVRIRLSGEDIIIEKRPRG